jgi:hypothetical protein
LPVQRLVPRKPHHDAAQVGDRHFGADAFQPVHAAEEADCRRVRPRAAEHEGLHRKAPLPCRDLAQHASFHQRPRQLGELLQFEQFRQVRRIHSSNGSRVNPG